MSTRLYEDFFDDNISCKQTSHKNLTDINDSPMEYECQVVICNDDTQIVCVVDNAKEKVESVIISTLDEFSSISDTLNKHQHKIMFGFNNTMRSPKVFRKFIKRLTKIFEHYYILVYYTPTPTTLISAYCDINFDLINISQKMFPYNKFRFQPFDVFMEDTNIEDRLYEVADIEDVYYKGQYYGVIDLSKLLNNPDVQHNYKFNHIEVSTTHNQIWVDTTVSKNSVADFIFKNSKDLKFENPYYQFGSDMKTGELYYSVDIMLGPVYFKSLDVVADLIISCTISESYDDEHGYKTELSRFKNKVDELFGGHMPETLWECIKSKVRHPD